MVSLLQAIPVFSTSCPAGWTSPPLQASGSRPPPTRTCSPTRSPRSSYWWSTRFSRRWGRSSATRAGTASWRQAAASPTCTPWWWPDTSCSPSTRSTGWEPSRASWWCTPVSTTTTPSRAGLPPLVLVLITVVKWPVMRGQSNFPPLSLSPFSQLLHNLTLIWSWCSVMRS